MSPEQSVAPACALIVGSGDGIGLGLTRRLLARGTRVLGVSRRPGPIEGAQHRHLSLDVARPDFREQLRQFIAPDAADLDLCVYTAGIGELFDARDLSQEGRVLRVNLLGAVETVEVVMPLFLARKGERNRAPPGHFIGLSSLGDEVRSAAAPSYAASKAGLSAYLVNLGLALAPAGVAITNLRFGFVDTKMAKAPQRPFMIPVAEAVAVIERAIRERPLQLSYPRKMAALVRLHRWLTAPGIWLRRYRHR